jgi:hypothetical protein
MMTDPMSVHESNREQAEFWHQAGPLWARMRTRISPMSCSRPHRCDVLRRSGGGILQRHHRSPSGWPPVVRLLAVTSRQSMALRRDGDDPRVHRPPARARSACARALRVRRRLTGPGITRRRRIRRREDDERRADCRGRQRSRRCDRISVPAETGAASTRRGRSHACRDDPRRDRRDLRAPTRWTPGPSRHLGRSG